jgi:C-terminal processing protease CtpA/Prc
MVRRLIAVVLLFATTAVADEARTQRLEKLCRVWAAAKYAHPAMMTSKIDWDGALVRAIPVVRAAATPAQLAAAVDAMLKEIGDPVTHVIAPRGEKPKSDAPLMHDDNGTLVIDAGPFISAHDVIALWTRDNEIAAAVAKASAVRLNLTMLDAAPGALFEFSAMAWSTEPVPVPGRWMTFFSGFDPEEGGTSGGYYSALTLMASKPLAAAKTAPKQITIVTDGLSPLPAFAFALARAGKAKIESSSALNDAAAAIRIDLGDGYAAQIRSMTYDSGGQAPTPVPIADAKYEEMKAPDLPYRLLAAFRIWSVIHYFYPYKHLIGDWDAVLHDFIPRFEEANDADAYVGAVLEMTSHVYDGHTGVGPLPAIAHFFPPATLPFQIRRVENAFAVIDKYDANAPVSIGDVVVSVDGEPIDARIQRLWKYATASTEEARLNRIAQNALRGPAGTTAQLGIRGKDGATRVVAVPRITKFDFPEPKDAPYRVLDGNIGYVDLRRLTNAQVDAMFDALMQTKALILDMRGYPRGTAWSIAPRINTRNAVYGASFRGALVEGAESPALQTSRGYWFDQPLPKRTKPLYTGKVVVLIDSRAISQAEHSCLFFEQAAGATFVGSPTAGANGDVTNFWLPGGLLVRFSGHDVRHADGRQLQRVGIQPDIKVEPTIAGLQAGKDEVLDRAIAYVNGGK